MGKFSRNKGAAAEREVLRIIQASGWRDARRTHDGRSQAGRNDVIGGPRGCAVEVKRQEKLNVPAALDQLVRDSQPCDIPVLIHRPSRHGWMATLPLEDLLPLLKLRES